MKRTLCPFCFASYCFEPQIFLLFLLLLYFVLWHCQLFPMSSIIGRSNSKFLYKGKSLDRRDKQWGPLSCLQIDYREIIQPSGEFSLGKSTISCDAACACVFYGRFDLAPAKGVLAFSLYKRSMRVIVTENRQHQMVWENSRPSTYIWTSRGHPKYFRKSRG